MPPPSTRPPRKGRGWMIFAIVLLVLLAFSVLLNFGALVEKTFSLKGVNTHTAGPRLEEVTLEDNDASAKIAVVEISGIITSQLQQGGVNMVDVIKAQLKRAGEDRKVKAVILKVDSPGGEVLTSDEIYRAIKDFKKPVICSMGSLAASGGYYVSAPCRWIVANELTITGSIGVIMSTWNYRHLMDKIGVSPLVFKSGKFKDMLSGSKDPSEITDDEKQMVQDLINETFGRFKDIVAEGRTQAYKQNNQQGQKLISQWKDYADGRVLSGTEVYKLGFVDELGNFEVAVKRARIIAGVMQANLVEYRPRVDLSDLLGLFGKSDAKAIKLDLGMDLPKLEAGHLYFLSPTYLH